jgi:hypothetical protein
LGTKIQGKLILALIASTISQESKTLVSAFSTFVAIIFNGIFVSSIFILPKTSLSFFSTLFHFKRPDLKSKSAIFNILKDFAKLSIS